jgi:hypothetical protein
MLSVSVLRSALRVELIEARRQVLNGNVLLLHCCPNLQILRAGLHVRVRPKVDMYKCANHFRKIQDEWETADAVSGHRRPRIS